MDYLYMGSSNDNYQYVLILRDDLYSYVWLWPSEKATSDTAEQAISRWVACFETMVWCVSDQGSYFKIQLLASLQKEFKVKNHYTTAYYPWVNGSVERICRQD